MVGASSVCPDSRNAIPPAQAGENLESQVSMASDAKAACRGVPQVGLSVNSPGGGVGNLPIIPFPGTMAAGTNRVPIGLLAKQRL
jgi:hypothetical protein